MALTRRESSPAKLLGWESGLQPNQATVPDLEMKLGSLVVLFLTTLLCGFIPLFIVRGAGRCNVDPKTRRWALRLMSGLAGGVFLATSLLDLLPVYLDSIHQAFNNIDIKLNFPLPEFIMAMGFFLVLAMEQMVLALKDQPAGPSEEKRSLLVDEGFQAHRRDAVKPPHHHPHSGEEFGGPGGPGVEGPLQLHHADFGSHSALRAFVLVLSLSLHSVLEGVAAGLRGGGGGGAAPPEVGLALVLHRGVLSFSLAVRLVQGRLRRAAVAGCVLLLAATSPLGVGLGAGLAEAEAQGRLVRATLEGLAAGGLLYVTFIDVLPQELASPGSRVPKVALLLTGFAAVTGVLFLKF